MKNEYFLIRVGDDNKIKYINDLSIFHLYVDTLEQVFINKISTMKKKGIYYDCEFNDTHNVYNKKLYIHLYKYIEDILLIIDIDKIYKDEFQIFDLNTIIFLSGDDNIYNINKKFIDNSYKNILNNIDYLVFETINNIIFQYNDKINKLYGNFTKNNKHMDHIKQKYIDNKLFYRNNHTTNSNRVMSIDKRNIVYLDNKYISQINKLNKFINNNKLKSNITINLISD